ncbi:MAG TPA: F0F1 ATP synthase subunit delta [Actinomycetes bacterium]|nr:F0F1 ATP synthase subunit delta [Actinomycetes bacterium]
MTSAGLQGASRESLKSARETLGALIRSGDTDLPAVSDDLFSLTALLDRELPLRRALTDPSRDGDARVGLARAVLGEHVGGATADLLAWVVRARWSAPRELATALELLAVEAQVAAAEKAGRLDAVEDELFRIARSVAGAPELRSALSDTAAPVANRASLIEGLLEGRTSEETRRLVRQAVVAPRGRTFDRTVELYGQVAADRRSRLVATVTASAPLTEEQRSRLGAVLRRIYGHEVHLNVQLDEDIVGGIRVEIGDEVIDGSVLSRLDEARRRLVG